MRHPLRYALPLLALVASCSSPPTSNTTSGVDSAVVTAPPTGLPPLADKDPGMKADPREPILAQALAELLAKRHLLAKEVDDEVSKKAFPLYLEQLDGGKLFLLKEHVTALETYKDKMDDQLRDGDLVLAHQGAAVVAKRREVVAKMVADILSKPFDLEKSEQAETDPEKLAFAATEDELRDRWTKLLKLQVLERLEQFDQIAEARAKQKPDADPKGKPPEPIPATLEAREEKARKDLATRFESRFTRWASVEPLEPAEQFLNAVASVYDPHTFYLAPAEKENFDISMTGTLEGIGAQLGEQDHYIMVRELVPGGASWQQGDLEAGDTILAVAQQNEAAVDITDMPIDKVVKMIRGPKNTVVNLTVKKPDGSIKTISITRDVIRIEASYARGALVKSKGGPQVGYIMLPVFYGDTRGTGKPGERNATEDVRKLLAAMEAKGAKGVIIDLRGNGGGLLGHARDITGLLIDTGPVVQARSSNRRVEVLEDEDPKVAFTGDVVVLVDRFSASASEILAGALQDYERAVIVGTSPTHGKGTVQGLIELDELKAQPGGDSLGVLKLTIQQFFRIDGESTQWKGVVPDILMPDPASFVDSGERSLPNSIPWSSVAALPFTVKKHGWDAQKLAAASLKRQAKEPVFGKVESFTKLIKSRKTDTTVDLKRETWVAERKKDKAELDAVDPKLADSKPRLTVTPIEDPATAAPPPPADKKKGRIEKWKEDLARDPWVEEAANVLKDMAGSR